jgi:thiamine-phosphate pyrophosphorylase
LKFSELSDKSLIYLITGGEATAANFPEQKTQILELINTAVQTKISLIQIREKQLPARLIYELTSEAARRTRDTQTKLLVNDRADIALAAGADGVHLTSRSLSATVIRRTLPKNFIVGVSAHTIKEAENARSQQADFVTLSPVFRSPGKGEPLGIELLQHACEALKPFPVIALGGVVESNYRSVLEAGASGFAAIRFLNNEKNLINLAANLRK